MRFKDVVQSVMPLKAGYHPGLQAVKAEHRERIVCDDTRGLAGSIDLDATLALSLPNEPRWDYGIGVNHSRGEDRVHWVEVHPATDGDVKDVLKKLAWLRAWLGQHERRLLAMTATENGFVWLATKDIGFRPGSPKAKQLAAQGISFPQRRLRLAARKRLSVT